MLNKLSFDDVYRRGESNDEFVKWGDVMKLLEEITSANMNTFSKYEVNQIMRREGVQLPLQTNW